MPETTSPAGIVHGRGRSWITTTSGWAFKGSIPGADGAATGEAFYRDKLARQLRGLVEVALPFGRADVATTTDVFEVEPVDRWRHGVRQVLAYAVQCNLVPNIALFGETTKDERLRMYLRLRDKLRCECVLWLYGPTYGWYRVTSRPAALRVPR